MKQALSFTVILKTSLFVSLVWILSCGRSSPKEFSAASPLLELGDYLVYDGPCTLNGAQPNVSEAIVGNYLCKAARAMSDNHFVYMELSPTSKSPQTIDVPWEVAELTLLSETATTYEYTGITESNHVRIRLSVKRQTTQLSDNAVTLEMGPTPFRLMTDPPPQDQGGFCNDPTKVAPMLLRLPFLLGAHVTVSQGSDGHFSHQNTMDTERHCMHINYAFDFGAGIGTNVYAASGGTVVRLKEDSNTGCGNASCSNMANYVLIKHANGTVAYYYHLMHLGVNVRVGQTINRGQLIAKSGNTGFSTGPHLHFEIRTADNRYTVPPYFKTGENPAGDLLSEGNTYTTVTGEW